MRPLSARERRLVALGLLGVALALVWLLALRPLIDGFSSRAAERQALGATYVRDQRLLASLPSLRASAQAQRRLAPRFALSAASEELAVEALKERLQHLSAEEGFAIASMEDLRTDAAPGAVKLRIDLTLTLAQLYETLRRLENEDAYVVIDFLSVTADRSLAAGRLAPLDVRLELSSDWRLSGSGH